jgi:ACS family hexuronate transporter-like MFS transporter
MESGSIPAAGKAVALYLRPQERSLGTGFNQVAITIGAVGASLLAGALAVQHGWRTVFLVAGVLGLLWIPIWLVVSKRIPHEAPSKAATTTTGIYGDPRLWGLLAANMLAMTGYSLWMNWTTKFLVATQGLSEKDANLGYAWVPSVLAAAGGLTGGSIAYRLGSRMQNLSKARIRTAWMGGFALLAMAAAPHVPTPFWATLIICWSLFWTLVISVNLYALPMDYFGPQQAGRAIAALTLAFGLMQTFLSYAIGWAVDKSGGYSWICAVMAILPLASCAILQSTSRLNPHFSDTFDSRRDA